MYTIGHIVDYYTLNQISGPPFLNSMRPSDAYMRQ